MLELDRDVCYRAVEARDPRFDGRFFTCVLTTGIYCRTICPARTPLKQNCRFLPSSAAAQEAGFRPCLRCRPEISPEACAWKGTSSTVNRALHLIADGALDGDGGVELLAARVGIGSRQLRRLFLQHVGVTPISLAQTRRFFFAKQLIHDTRLSMTEIAMAAGFGSIRRFNAAFKALYRRSPSDLRRNRVFPSHEDSCVRLAIPYRKPYDFESILRFLQARAITGMEVAGDESYSRTFEIGNALGRVEVRNQPDRNCLIASIVTDDLRSLPAVVRRVARVFDTQTDIDTVAGHLSRDPQLASLIDERPGLRAPGGWDGFEVAVRAILGQQITVPGAGKLAAKLIARFGKHLPNRVESSELSFVFPRPEALAGVDLTMLGIPRARAAALQSLATAVVDDPKLFERAESLEAAVDRLRALPGIGEWTAHYVALRALRETDAFPHSDIGLLRGVAIGGARPKPAALLARAEQWRPWRAYAAQHLWTHDELNGQANANLLSRHNTNPNRTAQHR